MKKILAILIASFMVGSLMGQVAKRKLPNCEGKMFMEAFESKNKSRLEMGKYRPISMTSSPVVLKSAQSVKQQLDSMAYEGPDNAGELIIYNKEIYTYTANGDIKQIHYHQFYLRNPDIPLSNYKTEYAYDLNRNCIQNMTSFWSAIDNHWIAVLKDDKIYDSNGKLTQSTNSAWDFNISQWVGRSKADNVYNSSGQNLQNASYEWDKIDNQWVGISKSELATDSIKGINSWYIWDKISSLWVIESKTKDESTYDSNGNLTQSIRFDWDNINSQWYYRYKNEINYNSTDMQMLTCDYHWDLINEKWVLETKVESTYNSSDQMTQRIQSYQNGSETVASEKDKWEYGYDTNRRLILTLRYIYSSGQFTLNTKSEFSYDSNGEQIGTFNYTWDNITSQWKIGEDTGNTYNPFGNKIQSIVSYKSDISSKTNWYYSDVETSITAPVSTTGVKTFPNPSSEYITFDLVDASQSASVELIDMQGKKVVSQILPQNKEISVSQLKSGMYFYRIQQNNKTYKGKVAVE